MSIRRRNTASFFTFILAAASLQAALAPSAAAQFLPPLQDPSADLDANRSLTSQVGLAGGALSNGTEPASGAYGGRMHIDYLDPNETLSLDGSLIMATSSPALVFRSSADYHVVLRNYGAPTLVGAVSIRDGIEVRGDVALSTDSAHPGQPAQIALASTGFFLHGGIRGHEHNTYTFADVEFFSGGVAGVRSRADGSAEGVVGPDTGMALQGALSDGGHTLHSHEISYGIRLSGDIIGNLIAAAEGHDLILFRATAGIFACARPHRVGDIGACAALDASTLASTDGSAASAAMLNFSMLTNFDGSGRERQRVVEDHRQVRHAPAIHAVITRSAPPSPADTDGSSAIEADADQIAEPEVAPDAEQEAPPAAVAAPAPAPAATPAVARGRDMTRLPD